MNDEVLIHHGIKGQKWGIRRFQNADGSLTVAGKKRYSTGETSREKSGLTDRQKTVLKNAGKVALIAGSVAAAGYLYTNNSEAINSAISKMSSKTLKSVANTAVKGHNYVQSIAKEAQQGVKKGVKMAPGKVAEGVANGVANASKNVVEKVVEGAATIAIKKMLEASAGKETVDASIQAYNAFNKKKKIGQMNSGKQSEDDDDE